MDPIAIMKALQVYGPYALVVFIAIAYYKKDRELQGERNKKDEDLKTLNEHLLGTIESHTESNIKLESAISGLQNLISLVINKRLSGDL